MNDSHIRKVSLILAILGIMALFLVIQNVEPVRITKLNNTMLGKTVIIQGKVTDFRAKKDVSFFRINHQQIVAFKKIALKNGNMAKVTGKVNKYKGSLEIISNDIEVIK